MLVKTEFGQAFRKLRLLRGMTQEDFSLVSSRTYISLLERGLKNPTVDKVAQIANPLALHPLTILAIAYTKDADFERALLLLDEIRKELEMLTSKKIN